MMKKFLHASRKLIYSKPESSLIGRYKSSLKINRMEEVEGEVLVDTPDTANELIENLAFAKVFSDIYRYEPRTYYTSIHLGGRKNLIGAIYRAMVPFCHGMRLARFVGLKRGLDHSIVDSTIRRSAKELAATIFHSLDSKKKLLSVTIEGIKFGEAVYDTYLRNYSCATVVLNDPRLFECLYEAALIYFSVKKYFSEHDVKAVLLGHAVYNNWKILSDYAILRGIDVYVTYNSFFPPIHHVNRHRGLQTVDHSRYKEDFMRKSPELRSKLIREGMNLMTQRLQGNIDPGISYMAASAYGDTGALLKIDQSSEKRPLVIMLHSFFDSPHVYKDMIFEDFSEWLKETLKYIQEQGLQNKYNIIIKPHPNRFDGEDEIIDELIADFNFVKKLNGNESNNSIMAASPAAIVTVYGTVSAEFSFMGIPVITCGDNPTSSFEFCFQANNKLEYFEFIRNAEHLRVDERKKIEVGMYAYMRYVGETECQVQRYPFRRSSRGDKGFVNRVNGFNYPEFKEMVARAIDRS